MGFFGDLRLNLQFVADERGSVNARRERLFEMVEHARERIDTRTTKSNIAEALAEYNARVDLYNEQKAQYMPMLSHYPIVRLLKLGITGADIDEARYQLTYKIALRNARWDSA
jgi:hypothetical protein